MKLIACCPLLVGGVRIPIGGTFESSDHSGAKLIARRAAKAPPRAKAKKAKAEAQPAAK